MIGETLGPYEIIEPLGAGGMGEVYLAQDTRLGRKVAVKVLPAEFAADPERLARFEQEARAAAALNHPHIAAVFDVGFEELDAPGNDGSQTADAGAQSDAAAGESATVGVHYIVQEYLKGDTLRAPLDKGALPARKALALAAELAEALTAAHAAGIVHRDLKPENIFVTRDGHAKVLDFGLAKLTELAPAMSPGTQASQSPTMLGTVAGQVMGTAGYMAPEQVQGDGQIDQRADLFAFGCVLYEMITGRRAFSGKNVFETLGQIVSEQPRNIGELDRALPRQLQWVIDKCLAKEPAERYQSAADLAVDVRRLAQGLESGLAAAPAEAAAGAAASGSARAGLRWRVPLPAALALVALTALAAWLLLPRGSADPMVRRFVIEFPVRTIGNTYSRGVTVSPDGRWIVFSAGEALWIREMGDFEARIVRGSDNGALAGGYGRAPVFSPNSERLAFWIDAEIVSAPVDGGEPVRLVDAPNMPHGLTWADDGYLYYGLRASTTLWRVAETGGEAEVVVELEDAPPADPQLLPGGDWLLFSGLDTVRAYSFVSGELKTIVEDAGAGRYLPSGHLAFIRGGDLLAQRFDPRTAAVSGNAVVVVEGISQSIARSGNFALSDAGDLVYRPGGSLNDEFLLTWLSPDGTSEVLPVEPRAFGQLRLSPDGTRIAAEVERDGGADIWIQELGADRQQRVTTTGDSFRPVWSPDGEWIYFASGARGQLDIWRRRADLSAEPEPVLQMDGRQVPAGVSADGRSLLFITSTDAGRDLYVLELDGSAEPQTAVATAADEYAGDISPDGRFVVLASDVAGGSRIFVHELATNRQWPISTGNGWVPRWSPGGNEVFFLEGAGISRVTVSLEPEFSASEPVRVVDQTEAQNREYDWDVAQQRVLTFSPALNDAAQSLEDTYRLHVVLNWLKEVEERLPAGASR